MAAYEERLLFPIDGQPEVEFFTKIGTLIARGYKRVVIGGRGPYVEFSNDQIIHENIHIPKDQEWRLEKENSYVFYNEYRSSDESSVKLYEQRKVVDYADYNVGCWYVSPFDLTSTEYPILIKPLDRKKKKK